MNKKWTKSKRHVKGILLITITESPNGEFSSIKEAIGRDMCYLNLRTNKKYMLEKVDETKNSLIFAYRRVKK